MLDRLRVPRRLHLFRSPKPLISLAVAAMMALFLPSASLAGKNAILQKSYGYYSHAKLWSNLTIGICWNESDADFASYAYERSVVQGAILSSWGANSKLKFIGWDRCRSAPFPINHVFAPFNGFGITTNDAVQQVREIGNPIIGDASGMNLNWKWQQWVPQCPPERDRCIALGAIHEFGHALGMYHEQERPDSSGHPCDLEASQVPDFGLAQSDGIEVGPYDLASVMNYCNPKFVGSSTGSFLSPTDIATIHIMYGDPDPLAVPIPPRTSSCGLIQSDFTHADGRQGDLETLVVERGRVVHYRRALGSSDGAWDRELVVGPSSSSQVSFLQSTYGYSDHKNFEVAAYHDGTLTYYWHDNTNYNLPWLTGSVISNRATGPGALVETQDGIIHAFVPEAGGIVHYRLGADGAWHLGEVVAPGGSAVSAIDSAIGGIYHLDLVALEGDRLVHYFSANGSSWTRAQTITSGATGGACLTQSTFGPHGDLEVLSLEGRNLVWYAHDVSNADLPWYRKSIVTTSATGPGAIFEATNHNFEVVVPEGSYVTHYYLDNSGPGHSWARFNTVTNL